MNQRTEIKLVSCAYEYKKLIARKLERAHGKVCNCEKENFMFHIVFY